MKLMRQKALLDLLLGRKTEGKKQAKCRDICILVLTQTKLHTHNYKHSWTNEECRRGDEARRKFGNKWIKVAAAIGSRDQHQVKNHYNNVDLAAAKRERFEEEGGHEHHGK